MSWITHSTDDRPDGLSEADRVGYVLAGDNTVRFDAAGALAWGLADGEPGRIERWFLATPSIGDADSTAPGTAVRATAGKPRLDLIPATIIDQAHAYEPGLGASALAHLGRFQTRQDGPGALLQALASLNHDGRLWFDVAHVFEYGLQKYAAWNWVRGMPWSVAIGSAMRHLLATEPNDPESGLPHAAHAACNLVMLAWYSEHYVAGDDRMPASLRLDETA